MDVGSLLQVGNGLAVSSIPAYFRAGGKTSVGESIIEMPQSLNFETISGSKIMRRLSTGASGMICLILSML